MIIGHNHPSGDPQPSDSDKELTDRLVRAGRAVGVTILDHVVVGENWCFSFQEGGLMLSYGLYPGVPLENIRALMDAMERYAVQGGD